MVILPTPQDRLLPSKDVTATQATASSAEAEGGSQALRDTTWLYPGCLKRERNKASTAFISAVSPQTAALGSPNSIVTRALLLPLRREHL